MKKKIEEGAWLSLAMVIIAVGLSSGWVIAHYLDKWFG